MSEITVNLQLPYILPSQAQKHVTHNEALQKLDAVTQLTVVSTMPTPPGDPADGSCYAIADTPTGIFSGKAGQLAFRQDGDWIFIRPRAGWRGWFLTDAVMKIHDGTQWSTYDAIGTPDRIGINTSADGVNRLAVAADATLFTHDGQGHQLKLNKAAAADTASLLFQTGYSGRAEMGLSGSDTFALKVSADGASWTTALDVTVDGQVLMPCRPLVRASRNGGTVTPASGSQTGFAVPSLAQGGFTLGAAVGGGGNSLIAPVTAAYLIVLGVEANPTGAFSVAVMRNGTTTLLTIGDNDATTTAYARSATTIALLQAGDALTLLHTGSTPIVFGYDKTELCVLML